MKKIGLLFFALLLATCLGVDEQMFKINAITQNLAGKYCPMRGFNGQSYCPNGGKTREPIIISKEDYLSTPSGKENANLYQELKNQEYVEAKINYTPELLELVKKYKGKLQKGATYDTKATPRSYSGFGFDRTNREMKFPVLPTGNPSGHTFVKNNVRQFNNVHEFIHWVLTPHGRMEAGLYARDIGVLRQMAQAFSESTGKLGITQKLYGHIKTSITSRNPLPEFKNAVDSLPPYDKNNPSVKDMYRMIINFWGTDVAMNVNHGGIVYQQTVIKKCFGGNIKAGMINDIDSAINNQQPGSGYIRYRKLGILEMRGGNPERSNIKDRIGTFRQAPAPLEWDSIPLWDVVSNAQRKAWIKAAIEDYVYDNRHTPVSIINEVRTKELNHFKRAQPVYLIPFNVEQNGNWLVRWTGCPYVQLRTSVYCPWCTLLKPHFNLAAGQAGNSGGPYNTHARVERDGNSGNIRIRMIEGSTNRFTSPWIRTGCTWVQQFGRQCFDRIGCHDISTRLYRAVCIDCLPTVTHQNAHHGQRHTRLNCVCPTF